MASTDAKIDMPLLREQVFVSRKRFKTTELPLNSTQRSTIDGLLHTIKKKGEYDALRKRVWSRFAESVSVEYASFWRTIGRKISGRVCSTNETD